MTKIVASCPHCFNTLGNEYPDFGGNYEVVHHTELLADLVREGRLEAKGDAGTITYHDSCYLARHNDVRADPREIVEAVGTPIEMERREERTFCCGAGGAHMWMEERAGPINEERVREAAETGAETLAVACPFCTVMLDDGVKSRGDDLRVVDVSTLLAESLDGDGEPRALDLLRPRLAVLDDERRERRHRRVRPSTRSRPSAGPSATRRGRACRARSRGGRRRRT